MRLVPACRAAAAAAAASSSTGAGRLEFASFTCPLSDGIKIKTRRVSSTTSGVQRNRTIVLLQDTIDSHMAFREMPELLSVASGGVSILQYDRIGQGDSTGFVGGVRPGFDFPERESECLTQLMMSLKMDQTQTVLVGVGDGATIAMAHAALAGKVVRGVVLMNPRLVAEQKILDEVTAMKANREELLPNMRRIHGEKADTLLDSFFDLWLSPEMAAMEKFDKRPLAKKLRCPVLTIHAENDTFTTDEAQLLPIRLYSPRRVETEVAKNAAPGRLPFLKPGVGPHMKQKQMVCEKLVKRIASFCNDLF